MTQDINQQISASTPCRRRRILIICAGILLIFLLCGGIMVSAALQPLIREAGAAPPAVSDFARFSFLPLQLRDDLSEDSFRSCGEHTVHFTLFGIPMDTTLTVTDTQPPAITLQDAAILGGGTVSVEDFLTEVQDASAWTAALSLGNDAYEPGTHTVTVTVTDAFGNKTDGTAGLTVYGKTDLLQAEAGISLSDLQKKLRNEIAGASFSDAFDSSVLSVPGETSAEILIDNRRFTVRLRVEDTTAPTADVRDVLTLLERVPSAADFLERIDDATAVTAAYITQPDCTRIGWQQVGIRLTDAAGNTADVSSYLRVYDIPASLILEAGVEQYIAIDEILANEPDCYLAERYNFPKMPAGVHDITVATPDGNVSVTLTIKDLTPPRAEPRQVVIYLPSTTIPTPADFVDFIEDASEVTASFVGEVDFATPGKSLVDILLTDTSGNTTTVTSYLAVVNDHTAPIITGVRNLSTYVNGRLSYKTGVSVTDGDGNATLTVDSSEVKLSVPGRYRITYTATDDAGNTSTATAYVTVLEITEDVIRPYAENILEKILKSGMTQREKARAIYDWMTANIAYVTYADKTYWMRAAYYGFTNGRGDCYVYYAMSRILLDCAGIQNMEICRDNPAKPHYWNLVNCGDGWYHFDTCPHYKQYPLTAFMLTDAEVKAYSETKVKDYYSFDKSLYPATP